MEAFVSVLAHSQSQKLFPGGVVQNIVSHTGVCEKNIPPEKKTLRENSMKTTNRGLERSFCCFFTGERLVSKEYFVHRHRYYIYIYIYISTNNNNNNNNNNNIIIIISISSIIINMYTYIYIYIYNITCLNLINNCMSTLRKLGDVRNMNNNANNKGIKQS